MAPSTTQTPEELFVASRWVSPACDPAASTRLHQVHIPDGPSENIFGALIDPAPEGLDFWIPPDPIPGEPGDVIWARHDADLEGGKSYLILYRSESVCGEPRAVSGWIAIPDGDAPIGGRPVLSWGTGTKGPADHCAPTRSGSFHTAEIAGMVGQFLSRGFVVVATDYEGHGTPGMYAWSQPVAQAKNILDASRAAQRFHPAEAGDKTFILGVSIGGHSVAKANEEAEVYAPDVDLIGVLGFTAGLVLSGNDWVPELLMRSSYSRGYMVLGAAVEEAIWGPELAPMSRRLTDLAVSHLDALEGEGCMQGFNEYFSQFEAEDLFRFPFDPAFTNGVNPDEVNGIGQKAGVAPMLIIHPTNDPALTPSVIIEYMETVCEYGQPILVSWQVGLHYFTDAFDRDEVISEMFSWVSARLDGDPPETHCGQIPDIPGMGEATAATGVPCNIFDSRENAQIFFDTNPDLGAGLDTDGDGIPCGLGDDHGLVDCGDGTTLLGHRCWFSLTTTCNQFATQAEAQAWLDAEPGDTGAIDQDGDGIACGEGDYGGARECTNGLVLARFCAGSVSSSTTNGENGTSTGTGSSGPDPADAGCGWFDSQAEAQEFFDANPTSGPNLDGNSDGTACGVGDEGGLTDCSGLLEELVLPQFCP